MTRLCAILAACLALASSLGAQPDMQPPRLVYQVGPVYPSLAKAARIQGTVRLKAIIGKQGTVDGIQLIDGHPFLIKAAFEAVLQWRYRPARDFGVPVQVTIEIDLPFRLGTNAEAEPSILI